MITKPSSPGRSSIPRLEYRFWCELIAAIGSESITSLAGEPTTTPRLAVRWLRWHAILLADRLDPAPGDPLRLGVLRLGLPVGTPDPAQALRSWAADDRQYEHAMERLRDKKRLEITVGLPLVKLTAYSLDQPAPSSRPRPPDIPAVSPCVEWRPAGAGHRLLHRPIPCSHPSTAWLTDRGVATCRCGVQRYATYQALGSKSLNVAARPPPAARPVKGEYSELTRAGANTNKRRRRMPAADETEPEETATETVTETDAPSTDQNENEATDLIGAVSTD